MAEISPLVLCQRVCHKCENHIPKLARQSSASSGSIGPGWNVKLWYITGLAAVSSINSKRRLVHSWSIIVVQV